MDLSRKTVLFYDASASYTHMAEALIDQFGAVKYFTPWESGFPVSMNLMPGIGIDGIERVTDFFDALDDADLTVFPDVGNAGLQEYIRAQGIPVFGSGRAEKLERDRWYLKQVCRDSDIDVSDAVLIRGFENVRKFLASHTDLWVKCSYLRGNMESHHHENMKMSARWLNETALQLGPYAAMTDFIIESPIDGEPCVEVGADPAFCCDGRFPRTILWGYEDKDLGYFGTAHILPAKMRATLDKLAPTLAEFGYRGPFSNETRETPEGSYVTDLTCRFPEPPSSVHRFIVSNWGEVMYGVATGEPEEPDYTHLYAVQLVLRSADAAAHPLAVEVGMPERVTLHGRCVIDGQNYAVSPAELEEFGAACGVGDSLEDAAAEALEAAHSVKGDGVKFDESAFDRLADAIRNGNKLGLVWGRLVTETEDHEDAVR